MMAEGPASLIYEWQAFYNLDPFGEVREDIRNAINCITIAQAMGMKKVGGGGFSLDDFMPKLAKPQKKENVMAELFTALKDRYGNNSNPGS